MSSILKVSEIQDPTNGNTALEVDNNGVVTRSVIPAWRVGRTSNQSISQGSSTEDVQWDRTTDQNCFLQGGCTISSGVVTVPVAGLYQINSQVRLNSVGGGIYIEVYIAINDVTSGHTNFSYFINGDPGSSYEGSCNASLFSLSANDNVRIKVYAGGDSDYAVSVLSNFSGVLIG